MTPIAALFVRHDSIYKSFADVDCWDASRDARKWLGGCPGVFHPPCRTWGCLAGFAKLAPPDEHAMGVWAIEQVRKWGGVLEHPRGSRLFAETRCALVNGLPDEWGEITIEVDQWRFGHKARKPSRLYIVGTFDIPPIPHRTGRPLYSVQGGVKGAAKGSGCKGISHREREETPPDFAAWLVELARKCTTVHL